MKNAALIICIILFLIWCIPSQNLNRNTSNERLSSILSTSGLSETLILKEHIEKTESYFFVDDLDNWNTTFKIERFISNSNDFSDIISLPLNKVLIDYMEFSYESGMIFDDKVTFIKFIDPNTEKNYMRLYWLGIYIEIKSDNISDFNELLKKAELVYDNLQIDMKDNYFWNQSEVFSKEKRLLFFSEFFWLTWCNQRLDICFTIKPTIESVKNYNMWLVNSKVKNTWFLDNGKIWYIFYQEWDSYKEIRIYTDENIIKLTWKGVENITKNSELKENINELIKGFYEKGYNEVLVNPF